MDKKKKDRERKAVKDDFYDRINYYESRNIFSSNEPFNPSNRLYTDQAALSHPVWSTIGKNRVVEDIDDFNKKRDNSMVDKELTQSLISSINKLNTTSSATPIGCKKCGYGKFYKCFN
jgi:hypothetical protein